MLGFELRKTIISIIIGLSLAVLVIFLKADPYGKSFINTATYMAHSSHEVSYYLYPSHSKEGYLDIVSEYDLDTNKYKEDSFRFDSHWDCEMESGINIKIDIFYHEDYQSEITNPFFGALMHGFIFDDFLNKKGVEDKVVDCVETDVVQV